MKRKNDNYVQKWRSFKNAELLSKLEKFVFEYIRSMLFLNAKKTKTREDQFFFQRKVIFFNRFLKNYSKTKLNRRCIFTKRSRSIYRPYNLSRCTLKYFLKFGFLPGFKGLK